MNVFVTVDLEYQPDLKQFLLEDSELDDVLSALRGVELTPNIKRIAESSGVPVTTFYDKFQKVMERYDFDAMIVLRRKKQ